MTPTARRKRWSISASCGEPIEVRRHFQPARHAGNTASAKYLALKGRSNDRHRQRIAQVYHVADYPLTTTGLVSFDTEGKIYAKYLSRAACRTRNTPSFIRTMISARITSTPSRHSSRAISTRKWSRRLTKISDPTVDPSQVVTLKSSGAEALLVAGTPKFSAQAIRKVAEIGWKPTLIVQFFHRARYRNSEASWIDNAVGVIVGTFIKDPTDSKWNDDAGMKGFRAFLR